jgi:hypothetical protein
MTTFYIIHPSTRFHFNERPFIEPDVDTQGQTEIFVAVLSHTCVRTIFDLEKNTG